MATGTTILRGVVHGKTIELEREPGLPNGQRVTVTVTAQPTATAEVGLSPGEGLRRSAGAWAEDGAELDEYLEWNRRQRKAPPRELGE